MAWLANNTWLIATGLVSFALTGLSLVYARRVGMIDKPSARRSHVHPTARGGGIAITATILLFLLLPVFETGSASQVWLYCCSLAAISLLGWIDDHKPVAARYRFAVQIIVALVVIAFEWSLLATETAWALSAGTMLIAVVLVLAICWNINLVNFMDGSNGLAAVTGLFAAAVLWWLNVLAVDQTGVLIASVAVMSIVGFLPWNWPFGRLFMGDAGSYAIGFTLAFLSMHALMTGVASLWQLILVQSVFLVDSSATLVFRVIRGEQWYTAHREHAYQRLLTMGMSHTRVLMIYSVINVFLILPVLVFIHGHEQLQGPIVLLTLLVLLASWWWVQYRWRLKEHNNHAE